MSSITSQHMTTQNTQDFDLRPRFEVTADGVFYVTPASTKTDQSASRRIYVCSPLFITGRARNESSRGWSRVLEFTDESGTHHVYCMPMSLLAGSGERLKAELLERGVKISVEPGAIKLLQQYLQYEGSHEILLTVDRIGWNNGVYTLPDCDFGTTEHRTIYVPKGGVTVRYRTQGGVSDWTQKVSRYAGGNSRLTFGICAAFAAPLLRVVDLEGGALHIFGPSSLGKTTILRIAVSVWGDSVDLLNTWRQTDNAQESTALAHNDSLLALDELSQCSPHAAGEAAYMLANGYGKRRANSAGDSANEKRWRVLVLSSGECTLAAHVATGGRIALAGQEVRFTDIPADAEQGQGIFDTLHGFPSGAALANHVTAAAHRFHGTAAREFLQHLTQADQDVVNQLKTEMDCLADELAGRDANSQVRRVALRFALLAVAGEYATMWGITGWKRGNATWAVKKCFSAWLAARGCTGNLEEQRIVAHVTGFIEQHGSSRFEEIGTENDRIIHNRAGFRRINEHGETEYLFLPKAFQNVVLAGFDFRVAKQALMNARMLVLPLGEINKIQVKRNLPGFPERTRVYAIRLPNEN